MFLLGLMNVFVMSNATKFHDDHSFYYDEEDEQCFKEKDAQWAKNSACYNDNIEKVHLDLLDFDN